MYMMSSDKLYSNVKLKDTIFFQEIKMIKLMIGGN